MLPAITESVGNGIDTWQRQERHGATPINSTTDDPPHTKRTEIAS